MEVIMYSERSKLLAESLGTMFLVIVVVGSGIMGEDLSSGNLAVALLANSIATGLGLFVLIQLLGNISGAHFNPLVSYLEYRAGKLLKKDLIKYVGTQLAGAVLGIFIVHLIFDATILQISSKSRTGMHLFLSEFVATFGLLIVIKIIKNNNEKLGSAIIASYIASAYWFTSSTSFANPIVTIARTLTDSFAGISPLSAIWFILSQILCVIFFEKTFKGFKDQSI
jgi:glycerol uptake facilitator-like aquaporin